MSVETDSLVAPSEHAYTVRFSGPLAAKIDRLKRESGLPATEILRLLVAKVEEISVRFALDGLPPMKVGRPVAGGGMAALAAEAKALTEG